MGCDCKKKEAPGVIVPFRVNTFANSTAKLLVKKILSSCEADLARLLAVAKLNVKSSTICQRPVIHFHEKQTVDRVASDEIKRQAEVWNMTFDKNVTTPKEGVLDEATGAEVASTGVSAGGIRKKTIDEEDSAESGPASDRESSGSGPAGKSGAASASGPETKVDEEAKKMKKELDEEEKQASGS